MKPSTCAILLRTLRARPPVVRRCLIIEDDTENARYVANGLRELGWSVAVCRDGVDAIGRAVDEAWDLIILDRMLPNDLDGLSILRTLRSLGRKTPVVVLSALAAGESANLLSLGAVDFGIIVEVRYAYTLTPKRQGSGRRAARVRALGQTAHTRYGGTEPGCSERRASGVSGAHTPRAHKARGMNSIMPSKSPSLRPWSPAGGTPLPFHAARKGAAAPSAS